MFSARYSSLSSAASSPHSASTASWRSSNASEMYFRKIRPRTTCLYSASSIEPRSASAIAHNSASWPAVAPSSRRADALSRCFPGLPRAILQSSAYPNNAFRPTQARFRVFCSRNEHVDSSLHSACRRNPAYTGCIKSPRFAGQVQPGCLARIHRSLSAAPHEGDFKSDSESLSDLHQRFACIIRIHALYRTINLGDVAVSFVFMAARLYICRTYLPEIKIPRSLHRTDQYFSEQLVPRGFDDMFSRDRCLQNLRVCQARQPFRIDLAFHDRRIHIWNGIFFAKIRLIQQGGLSPCSRLLPAATSFP